MVIIVHKPPNFSAGPVDYKSENYNFFFVKTKIIVGFLFAPNL